MPSIGNLSSGSSHCCTICLLDTLKVRWASHVYMRHNYGGRKRCVARFLTAEECQEVKSMHKCLLCYVWQKQYVTNIRFLFKEETKQNFVNWSLKTTKFLKRLKDLSKRPHTSAKINSPAQEKLFLDPKLNLRAFPYIHVSHNSSGTLPLMFSSEFERFHMAFVLMTKCS